MAERLDSNAPPFTPETLGERWSCSAQAIRNMIARGELAAFRVGSLLRIRAAVVRAHEEGPCDSSATEAPGTPSGSKAAPPAAAPSVPRIVTLPNGFSQIVQMNQNAFWSKVAKAGPAECWPWQAAKNKTGYGRFKVGRRLALAHRVAYELTNGPIPEPEHPRHARLCVMHACDNPACCNPAHLSLGHYRDNNRAVYERGRRSKRTPSPSI